MQGGTAAVERVFREEYGRLIASLVRRFGDIDIAEEAAAEAFLAAKYRKTWAQIVIRWHLDSGLSVIPRSVSPERIRQNIDVFDFELDDLEVRTEQVLHTACARRAATSLGRFRDRTLIVTLPRAVRGFTWPFASKRRCSPSWVTRSRSGTSTAPTAPRCSLPCRTPRQC